MKQFIYILVALLFLACYDDKGNYDYRDINEVDIVLPTEYSIYLEKDTVLVIKPELSQTLQKNAGNLRYSWFHSVKGTNFHTTIAGYTDTISFSSDTASFITYRFDPADKDLVYKHFFRFEIEDMVTGVVYPMNTNVSLGKPYSGAWMILQKDGTGKARLGAIQYVGENIKVEPDVFAKKAGGSPFMGTPVCLGRYAGANYMYQKSTTAEWMTLSVITDRAEESGTYCQWKQFGFGEGISLDGATTQSYVFDEGVCLQTSARNLDVAKMRDYDGEGSRGSMFLADGQLYSVLKSAKVSKAAVHTDLGEVNITHAAKVAKIALGYDAKGHRFVFYSLEIANNAASALFTSNDDTKVFNTAKLNKVTKKADDLSDPSVISAGEEVLFIGSGYNYNVSNMSAYTYGYALTLKGDRCKIYEFDVEGITGKNTRSLVNTYEFDRPAHLTKESCFASSSAFDGLLFYTSGTNVYRLDFKQSKPSEVAIASLNSEAVQMKFARTSQVASKAENLAAYSGYEFDINRSLGIVCKIGGTVSEFVVINLSASGNVDSKSEHYSAQQTYNEFDEIVDFVFI